MTSNREKKYNTRSKRQQSNHYQKSNGAAPGVTAEEIAQHAKGNDDRKVIITKELKSPNCDLKSRKEVQHYKKMTKVKSLSEVIRAPPQA